MGETYHPWKCERCERHAKIGQFCEMHADLVTDGGTTESDTEREEPFWQIKPHRSVVRDIDKMRDNLDELESIVREAEWVELGGRGHADVESAERICEAVEASMPFILDSIRELAECNDCDVDAETSHEGASN